jgi:hypothetical protein
LLLKNIIKLKFRNKNKLTINERLKTSYRKRKKLTKVEDKRFFERTKKKEEMRRVAKLQQHKRISEKLYITRK